MEETYVVSRRRPTAKPSWVPSLQNVNNQIHKKVRGWGRGRLSTSKDSRLIFNNNEMRITMMS